MSNDTESEVKSNVALLVCAAITNKVIGAADRWRDPFIPVNSKVTQLIRDRTLLQNSIKAAIRE